METNTKFYDIAFIGHYTKDTIISSAGTRVVDGGAFNYGANIAARMGLKVAAITRLAKEDFSVVEKLKENEKVIGEQLSKAIKRARIEERTIGTCPVCKTGKLMILYSRKTGKRFIGCTNYFKNLCKTSFPLPQRGTVRPTGRNCRRCNWPTVRVKIKGRRPWTLCFNPDCPLKEERRKSD